MVYMAGESKYTVVILIGWGQYEIGGVIRDGSRDVVLLLTFILGCRLVSSRVCFCDEVFKVDTG